MKSAPLKLISGTSVEPSTGVIIYLHLRCLHEKVMLLLNPCSLLEEGGSTNDKS